MSNKNNLSKIKAQYIIENIFDYIYDEDYKYKLFTYSKYYQNKFNITLYEYKEKYIEQIDLDLFDYFSCYKNDDSEYKYPKGYDKSVLNKKFSKFEIEPNDIKNIIINYAEKYYQYIIEEYNIDEDIIITKLSEILIDIYSPFFDIISKSEIFGKIFTIPISVQFIEANNLMIIFLDLIN